MEAGLWHPSAAAQGWWNKTAQAERNVFLLRKNHLGPELCPEHEFPLASPERGVPPASHCWGQTCPCATGMGPEPGPGLSAMLPLGYSRPLGKERIDFAQWQFRI